MKKVMQTVTGLGSNCEGATIATLLGLELSEIPDFWEGCDKENPTLAENGVIYQQNLNNFLEKYGYKMLNLGVKSKDMTERDQQWVIDISKHLGVKHLVVGISPRGHMHSVIYENGELWHDPHPEGGGVKPCQLCLLVPIFREENTNPDNTVKKICSNCSIETDQLFRYIGPVDYVVENVCQSCLNDLP